MSSAVEGEAIKFGGVELTSPDKVLYPEQGLTKLDLARYMAAVSDEILPQIARRPVTLLRCPAGRDHHCFYQRHAGSGIPTSLSEIALPGFDQAFFYVRDYAGLLALAQMGVLEIHPWNMLIDQPERPDRMILDLDPGEGLSFADVVPAAHQVRAELARAGLDSFVKTTGGRGIHVVTPLAPRHDWPRVKAFAHDIASALAAREPNRYLIRMSKAERRGRIFIDYLRNDPAATAIAAYSTRARPGAPVAMPVSWDALTPDLDPSAFNLRTVPKIIATRGADPWAAMAGSAQNLPAETSFRRPARRARGSAR